MKKVHLIEWNRKTVRKRKIWCDLKRLALQLTNNVACFVCLPHAGTQAQTT